MRPFFVCLLTLGPCGALASDPKAEPLDSSDRLAIQAVLETFAEAWMTGDRPALERVLHEDYAYFTSPEADAPSWDRDTEIGFACTMAKSGTVRSFSVTATEITEGVTAGEFSVTARLDSRLIIDGGDTSDVSTVMLFILKRNHDGVLQVWRQVDPTGAKQ